jgi:hypothetical protein
MKLIRESKIDDLTRRVLKVKASGCFPQHYVWEFNRQFPNYISENPNWMARLHKVVSLKINKSDEPIISLLEVMIENIKNA